MVAFNVAEGLDSRSLRSAEIGDQPYWQCSASRSEMLPAPNKTDRAINHRSQLNCAFL